MKRVHHRWGIRIRHRFRDAVTGKWGPLCPPFLMRAHFLLGTEVPFDTTTLPTVTFDTRSNAESFAKRVRRIAHGSFRTYATPVRVRVEVSTYG